MVNAEEDITQTGTVTVCKTREKFSARSCFMYGWCTSVCREVTCRKRDREVLRFSYEHQERNSVVFHYFLLFRGTVFSSCSGVGFHSRCSALSSSGVDCPPRAGEGGGNLSSRQQFIFVGVFVPPSSMLHISHPCEQQKEQKELCAPAFSFPLVPSSHLLSPSPPSVSVILSSTAGIPSSQSLSCLNYQHQKRLNDVFLLHSASELRLLTFRSVGVSFRARLWMTQLLVEEGEATKERLGS